MSETQPSIAQHPVSAAGPRHLVSTPVEVPAVLASAKAMSVSLLRAGEDGTPRPRRRGRRPAGSDTRETIRRAARELFLSHGYDHVSIRAVARAADVDPALVHHYFRNKCRLYVDAVLGVQLEDADQIARSLDGVQLQERGRAIARVFAGLVSTPGSSDVCRRLLCPPEGNEASVRSFREFLVREVTARFGDGTTSRRQFELRAQRVVAHLMGTALSRHVLELPLYVQASQAELVELMAPVLQMQLEDPVPQERRTARQAAAHA